MAFLTNRALGSELQKRGLLPDNCREARLVVSVDGALVIQYEVYVTDEMLAAMGATFLDVAERIRESRIKSQPVEADDHGRHS